MVTPYVKFSRGTPLAYKNLAEKNADTLYFITDSDSSKSKLYLGSELISSEIAKLSDLEDLVLGVVGEGELLVYDGENWVNKSVTDAIGVYAGCTEEEPGKAGLVPAAAAGQADYFLAGDGTWKQVKSETPVSPTQVFEATVEDGETAEEAITRVVGATGLNKGDIGVAKKLIAGDKYEYTAFVYNGSAWAAMDGNYSAENVYFNSDFVFTEKIGTVQTLINGSATVTAEGKSVKEFFAGLFAKENTNINVTQPSVSITLGNSGAKEVGTKITPSYSVSFNKGSYQYGPDTGITATYVVKNSANADESSTATSGSFSEITVGTDTSYTVSVTATHTAGSTPVSNLGNELPAKAIAEGTKSATSSGKYTGYRNTFYGTLSDKDSEITSDVIRNLTKSGKALANGSAFTLNLPVGAMRAVIAYPATLREINSVTDTNGMGAQVKGSFTMTTVDVEGVNGYEAIPYRVYVAPFADPLETANTYKVTI